MAANKQSLELEIELTTPNITRVKPAATSIEMNIVWLWNDAIYREQKMNVSIWLQFSIFVFFLLFQYVW